MKMERGLPDRNGRTSCPHSDLHRSKYFVSTNFQEHRRHLQQFKQSAEHPETIEYKIGEIFSEIKNKVQSGYNLREVINLVDELRFRSHAEKHEMSALYEDKIKNMGNAGRNGGEYYMPRPLIKTMVKVIKPQIGGKERVEVQQNFPIKTGETAFLFLQHFIKRLKAGGRGAVVIKNTFLSNSDNAAVSLRQELKRQNAF